MHADVITVHIQNVSPLQTDPVRSAQPPGEHSLELLAALILLAVSMILAALISSHKPNHTTFVLYDGPVLLSLMSSRCVQGCCVQGLSRKSPAIVNILRTVSATSR